MSRNIVPIPTRKLLRYFLIGNESLCLNFPKADVPRNIPGFKMRYEVDPVRQAIAESWPDKMDDSCAREEWDWKPTYSLDAMTRDMILHLREKLCK